MVGVVTQEHVEALGAVAARLDEKGLVDESRIVRDVLAQVVGARELRAAEAAEILAVTPQTVRNWVRAGVLPGRRDQTGHFYVEAEALLPALRMRQALPDQPAGAVREDEIDAEIEAARAERRQGDTRGR